MLTTSPSEVIFNRNGVIAQPPNHCKRLVLPHTLLLFTFAHLQYTHASHICLPHFCITVAAK